MKSNPRTAIDGLPSYPIKPGVTFPDWSVVESPVARDALLAIFEVFDMDRVWHGYTAAEDTVRTAVLSHYRRNGKAPTIAELTALCDMAEDQIAASLQDLKARDLVVLDDTQRRLTGAYPFTERNTGHRVKLGDTSVNAMCAIDALGAGAMVGSDTRIESSCRHCTTPIRITTRRNGHAIGQVSPAETVAWTGIQYEGQAATSLCTVTAFFCCDAHLDAWRADNRQDRGYRMSVDQGMQTGMAIFKPFLAGSGRHDATLDGRVSQ